MDLIAKISRGSKMDQIYLPKNRLGLPIGQYVSVIPLEAKQRRKTKFKPYFYNLRNLEPLKLELIEKIFDIVDEIHPENIIITGSFLQKGFKFNDIDVLIVKEEGRETNKIQKKIEELIQIKTHILILSAKTLNLGLSTDPLYILMLSRCVSKSRLIFKTKRKIDYKLLDLQLLKSKTLIDNFELLNGEEKYYFTMNMVSILLFIEGKKLTKEIVDKSLEGIFSVKVKELKENLVEKSTFIKKYKEIYNSTFSSIMESIHEQK